MGPDPAVAAVRVAVRRALGELPAGMPVLVACSGGADSLALAAATAFEAPRAGRRAGPGAGPAASPSTTGCRRGPAMSLRRWCAPCASWAWTPPNRSR